MPIQVRGIEIASAVNPVMHMHETFGSGGHALVAAVSRAGRAGNVSAKLGVGFAAGVIGDSGDRCGTMREVDAVQGEETVVGGGEHAGQAQVIVTLFAGDGQLDGAARQNRLGAGDDVTNAVERAEQRGEWLGVAPFGDGSKFAAGRLAEGEELGAGRVADQQRRGEDLLLGQVGDGDTVSLPAVGEGRSCRYETEDQGEDQDGAHTMCLHDLLHHFQVEIAVVTSVEVTIARRDQAGVKGA